MMNRLLVATTMTLAPIALAVAAVAAGLSLRAPTWWPAAVQLAVLGCIAPMIYAVNIRIVPVFSRRDWRSAPLLRVQLAVAILGGWLSFAGKGLDSDGIHGAGQLLALGGGALFMANIVMLFRQSPSNRPGPPLPHPSQAEVDRVATRFTRLSGMFLVVGLATGVAMVWWTPDHGRWDLVWAHALLLGFFVSMASGVCYHVLSRWTGQPWQSVMRVQAHYLVTLLALPLMMIALAFNLSWLFLVAGPLQGVAFVLLIWNIVPLVWHLSGPVRLGIMLAVAALMFGVALGVLFAVDAGLGAKFRQVHATANLFGWAGLLISGFGYFLVPQIAGTGIRWVRLAWLQLATLATGVVLCIGSLFWRLSGDGPDWTVMVAQGIVGVGLLLLAIQVAGIFARGAQQPSLLRPTVR